jgi:hypothetical protein
MRITKQITEGNCDLCKNKFSTEDNMADLKIKLTGNNVSGKYCNGPAYRSCVNELCFDCYESICDHMEKLR